MGYFQRRLVKLVVGVVHFPKLTLAICGVILVASVGFAYMHLQLSTDEDDLLTPKLAFFREFKQFSDEFPENDAFIIVLEPLSYAHPPLAARWAAYADRMSESLTSMKDVVTRVDARVPPESIGAQGMMFDEWDNIRDESKHATELGQFARIVGDPNSIESIGVTGLGSLIGTPMTQRVIDAASKDKPDESGALAEEVMHSLATAIRSPRPFNEWTTARELPSMPRADPTAKIDPRQLGYNMLPDETKRHRPDVYKKERILVISVHTAKNYSSMAELTEPLKRMCATVNDVAKDFRDFKPPVITGREAMQSDQMEQSDHDTRLAEIFGLSLVFIVLLIFLRNLWLVIAAELCLGIGIGWTFGWATVMVGRLNLLSLVFVIALIGIGMDYLIQILTRYRFEKKRYGRPTAIWARVFRFVSAPISTACAGAAAAFFAAMFTDFHGAAELGLIAGGGLLLCLAAGYTVLPAMLTVFPAKVGKVHESRRYRHRERHPRAGGRRLLPVAIWIVVAAIGLLVALPPHFDPDLIKLQDEDLPSVSEVEKVNTWSAVILSPDLGKLEAARKALEVSRTTDPATGLPQVTYLSTVDHTESILDAEDKQKWLVEHNAAAIKVNWREPTPLSQAQLQGIANAGEKLATQWSKLPAGSDGAVDVSGVVAAAHELSEVVRDPAIPIAEKLARANEWQKRFVQEVRTNAEGFAPPPPDINTLPVSLREHLLGDSKVKSPPDYALYIYPKGDLWNFTELKPFVEQLETRMTEFKQKTGSDVLFTGIAPQLYHSTNEIQHAFLQSTLFALIAIVLLVLIDLRNVLQTLMAVSVLALGLPMLLLAMYIWREKLHDPFGVPGSWNLANFFALPILIGAGHEYGVFMVHRYRESLADPRRVWRPWDVADRALLLCGIVTSCSFGFLVFANHHGLQSLGWVMAVGTACIYLSALLVLRPILVWRLKMKRVYAAHHSKEHTAK